MNLICAGEIQIFMLNVQLVNIYIKRFGCAKIAWKKNSRFYKCWRYVRLLIDSNLKVNHHFWRKAPFHTQKKRLSYAYALWWKCEWLIIPTVSVSSFINIEITKLTAKSHDNTPTLENVWKTNSDVIKLNQKRKSFVKWNHTQTHARAYLFHFITSLVCTSNFSYWKLLDKFVDLLFMLLFFKFFFSFFVVKNVLERQIYILTTDTLVNSTDDT